MPDPVQPPQQQPASDVDAFLNRFRSRSTPVAPVGITTTVNTPSGRQTRRVSDQQNLSELPPPDQQTVQPEVQGGDNGNAFSQLWTEVNNASARTLSGIARLPGTLVDSIDSMSRDLGYLVGGSGMTRQEYDKAYDQSQKLQQATGGTVSGAMKLRDLSHNLADYILNSGIAQTPDLDAAINQGGVRGHAFGFGRAVADFIPQAASMLATRGFGGSNLAAGVTSAAVGSAPVLTGFYEEAKRNNIDTKAVAPYALAVTLANAAIEGTLGIESELIGGGAVSKVSRSLGKLIGYEGSVMAKPAVQEMSQEAAKAAFRDVGKRGLTREAFRDFTEQYVNGFKNKLADRLKAFPRGFLEEGLLEEVPQTYVEEAGKRMFNADQGGAPGQGQFRETNAGDLFKQAVESGIYGGLIGGGMNSAFFYTPSVERNQTLFNYIDDANQRGTLDTRLNKLQQLGTELVNNGEITPEQFDQTLQEIGKMQQVSNFFKGKTFGGGVASPAARAQAYSLSNAYNEAYSVVGNWESGQTQQAIQSEIPQGDPGMQNLYRVDNQNKMLAAELEYNKALEMSGLISDAQNQLGTEGKMDLGQFAEQINEVGNKSYADYGLTEPQSGYYGIGEFVPSQEFEFGGRTYAKGVGSRGGFAQVDKNGYKRLDSSDTIRVRNLFSLNSAADEQLNSDWGGKKLGDAARQDLAISAENPDFNEILTNKKLVLDPQITETAKIIALGDNLSPEQQAINERFSKEVKKRVKQFKAETAEQQRVAEQNEKDRQAAIKQEAKDVIDGKTELSQVTPEAHEQLTATFEKRFGAIRKGLQTFNRQLGGLRDMNFDEFTSLPIQDQLTIFRAATERNAEAIAQYPQILQNNNINLANAVDPATEIESQISDADRTTAALAKTERSSSAVDSAIRNLEEANVEDGGTGQAESTEPDEQLAEAAASSGSTLESLQQLAGSLGIEIADDVQTSDVAEVSPEPAPDNTSAEQRPAEQTTRKEPTVNRPVETTQQPVGRGPVTNPDFYLSTPNKDGSFKDTRNTSFDPSRDMYNVKMISPTEAEISLTTDATALADARSFPDTFLTPVAEVTGDIGNIRTPADIRTTEPGRIQLRDGRWTVTQPIQVSVNPNVRESVGALGSQSRITVEQLQRLSDVLDRALPGRIILPETLEQYDELYRSVGGDRQSPPNGFVLGDQVVLNPDTLDYQTPIHEYGHIWMTYAKQFNPELYQQGLQLVSQSPALISQIQQNYPNLSGDALLEEALVTLIGYSGEQSINEQGGDQFLESVLGDTNPTLIQQIKNWLKDLWDSIGKFFGIKKPKDNWQDVATMSLGDFANNVAGELLGGQRLFEGRTIQPQQGGISERVPLITPQETTIENPMPAISALRDDIFSGNWFDNVEGLPVQDIVDQLHEDFDNIVNQLADAGKISQQDADLLSNDAVVLDLASQLRRGRGDAQQTVDDKSTSSIVRGRIKEADTKKLFNMLFESPRGPESIGQKYTDWLWENHYMDEDGKFRKLEDQEVVSGIKNQEKVIKKLTNRWAGFHPANLVFRLSGEKGGFGKRRANAETFARLMGGKDSSIRHIMDDTRVQQNRNGSILSTIDNKSESQIYKAFAPLTTFAGFSDADTVKKVQLQVMDRGVPTDIELPVDVAMDLYGQYKSQLSTYTKNGEDRSSVIYDPERGLTEKTSDGKDRGAVIESWRDGEPGRQVTLDKDQAAALAAEFEQGGQYAKEFQMMADHYNNKQRFGILDNVVTNVTGRSLRREGFYWPTKSAQERDTMSGLTGVDPLLFDLGFLQDRTNLPSAIRVGSAVAGMANHNKKAQRLVENGVILRSLASWNDKANTSVDYSARVNNLRKLWLDQYLKDLNGTSKDAIEKDNEDEKFLKKIARNATTSIFAMNLGTPIKNFTGYTTAAGQGGIDNSKLFSPEVFGKVLGRSLAGYGGFFNWAKVGQNGIEASNPIEDYWADRDAIQEIANNPYASSVLWRVMGGQHDSVFASFDAPGWHNAAMDALANKGQMSRQDVETLKRAYANASGAAKQSWQYMNQRFLSALARADRAVIIGFYDAAKAQVQENRGETTSDEAQKEIAALAERAMYSTNNTAFDNDKTGLQRSNNIYTRIFGVFSAQQQKVTNLVVQNMVDYEENPTAENRKKLNWSIGLGLLGNTLAAALVTELVRMGKQVLSGSEVKEPTAEGFAWNSLYGLLGYLPGLKAAGLTSALSLIDDKPFTTDFGIGIDLGALNDMREGLGSVINAVENGKDLKYNDIRPLVGGAARATGFSSTLADIIAKRSLPKKERVRGSGRVNSGRQTN